MRTKELGRARPNGAVTYPEVDEQILFLSFSLLCRDTGGGRRSLENS
jgi:hypothetical protein